MQINTNDYDLIMDAVGFNALAAKLKQESIKNPQVYLHVANSIDGSPRILRIGSAKNGIRDRWIVKGNGHRATFEWATGDSHKYKMENAVVYQNYLLFFASLFGMSTKLFTITFPKNDEGYNEMLKVESQLISMHNPFWEWFRPKFKKITEKHDLRGLQECGGALKSIKDNSSGYRDDFELMFYTHSDQFSEAILH